MSKVISFSISDRYLDKLRSLYPSLTDNLAAKQFLTDRLSNSLDDNLDAGLDGKLKSLIESWVDGLLDERLDAVMGKLLTSLSERIERIEERLDTKLDGRLDDMERLLKLQRESSIASPLPPSPPDRPAIETVTPEVSPSPPGAIASIDGTVESVEPNSSIETVASAIEADDREWLTLQQIADKKIKGLPGTYQGLSPYAENWEWRENPTKKGKQYKIPKEYL